MKKLADSARPIEILLVEDNPGDVFLTKKAFETSKLANHLVVAPDGEVALKMLKKEDEYEAQPTPDIILLDLNLPKVDGKEVLEAIKEDEKLRKIPVVILTSSNAEKDILMSYELHANSYIVKPVDFSNFLDIVNSIESFWFSIVVLPE
ncbi:MAG: response regulator [Lentisphaeraceae bacterium]|nr:response regulator [Lentisphaeraceae bacterium]